VTLESFPKSKLRNGWVVGVKIPFSFSSKQNGYSATDQINVMKLRLPICNSIAVNHDVIEVN
jgi:hypothetical protein